MRGQLGDARGGGDRVVLHPGGGDCRGAGGEQGRDHEGRRQLGIAAPHDPERIAQRGIPVRRQRFGGEEAADDEEDLRGDAGVAGEPVEQLRQQDAGVVGHRAVEGEVVQYDQLRSAGFQ